MLGVYQVHIGIYMSTQRELTIRFGEAFKEGVERCGDRLTLAERTDRIEDFDVVALFGIAKRTPDRIAKARRLIVFDKSYARDGERNRVSIGDHHPSPRALMHKPIDTSRAARLGWLDFKPWKTDGKHILIASSSSKFHSVYSFETQREWLERTVKGLRKYTKRPMVFRPKLSDNKAKPLKGIGFSRKKFIHEDLKNCYALVTFGSNSVFEAMRLGIPQLVTGPAPTVHLCSHHLDQINDLYQATDDERMTFFSNLAYHDWSRTEYRKGIAWEWIKSQLLQQQIDS